jgi:lysophospholipase L1-like esterase
MPLGDSITKGFHNPFQTRGSYRLELEKLLQMHDIDYDFVGEFKFAADGLVDGDHQAVAGYRIERMVEEFGPAIANHQPDVALILAGTNNHWDEPVKTEFVARFESLVDLVHSNSPDTTIVFATVPEFGCCKVDPAYWTAEWVDERNQVRIPTMNEALVEVANKFDFVQWVDLNAVLDPATDLGDGDFVHPNIYGHRKLASLYFNAITGVRRNVVDVVSVDQLIASMREGSPATEFDLDQSGTVDADDLRQLIEVELQTWFGDANLDGHFDSRDLVGVFQNGEYQDDLTNNSQWAEGDWDGDGDFAEPDLTLALTDGAYEQGFRRVPIVVPEPSAGSLVLLSLACLAVDRRRRRR